MPRLRNLAGALVALTGAMAGAPAFADEATLYRDVFRPGYMEGTTTGKAILAAAVNSNVDEDIAFSALNDVLALSVTAASGGTIGADPASGYALGSAISAVTDAFKDTDAQVPRLAKFGGWPATFLQMDNGEWCTIQDGNALAIIEDDALEPFTRRDIPRSAQNTICRSPDGFYKSHVSNIVYFFYSSNERDPTFYGIGFGDSYCAIPNEAMWQELAKRAHPDVSEYNVRQPTLFRPADIGKAAVRRTDRGVCTGNERENRTARYTTAAPRRSAFFPDHYAVSGRGAALLAEAESDHPIGDALTSETVGFMSGFVDFPFTGTALTALAAASAPTTTVPQMAMRPGNPTVYLAYDTGAWCAMDAPDLLRWMKDDTIGVTESNAIPGNVQPGSVEQCRFPDGFFRTASNPTVYYLFSTNASNPTWYGVGFGDAYCAVPSRDEWIRLAWLADLNGNNPQETLHTSDGSNERMFKGRRQVTCPTSVNAGVASGFR